MIFINKPINFLAPLCVFLFLQISGAAEIDIDKVMCRSCIGADCAYCMVNGSSFCACDDNTYEYGPECNGPDSEYKTDNIDGCKDKAQFAYTVIVVCIVIPLVICCCLGGCCWACCYLGACTGAYCGSRHAVQRNNESVSNQDAQTPVQATVVSRESDKQENPVQATIVSHGRNPGSNTDTSNKNDTIMATIVPKKNITDESNSGNTDDSKESALFRATNLPENSRSNAGNGNDKDNNSDRDGPVMATIVSENNNDNNKDQEWAREASA